jgi:predicted phosphodiesterase
MTDTPELAESEAIAGTTVVQAQRIGLVGDEHCAGEDGSDLPGEVLAALDGVDLIIQLGHMGTREILGRGVLDRYAKVAPVLAVRDYSTSNDGNPFVTPADGDRVAGLTRVIETGGFRIGALHNPGRPPGRTVTTAPGGLPELGQVPVPETLAEKFGGPVDIVAYASSHRPAAISAQGVLFVNPGSPTYPKGPGRTPGQAALGTVGILELSGSAASYEVIELSLLQQAKEHG